MPRTKSRPTNMYSHTTTRDNDIADILRPKITVAEKYMTGSMETTHEKVDLIVKPSNLQGANLGLFAGSVAIEEGQIFAEYFGDLYSTKMMEESFEERNEYAVQINPADPFNKSATELVSNGHILDTIVPDPEICKAARANMFCKDDDIVAAALNNNAHFILNDVNENKQLEDLPLSICSRVVSTLSQHIIDKYKSDDEDPLFERHRLFLIATERIEPNSEIYLNYGDIYWKKNLEDEDFNKKRRLR